MSPMFQVPATLVEELAQIEAAVGLASSVTVRLLNGWSELGSPEQVAMYTVAHEYLQMIGVRGSLANLTERAVDNNAVELSHWLVETIDPLDDAFVANTTVDLAHHNWQTSNFHHFYYRRIPRDERLANDFRDNAQMMTANVDHRVICSGATTELDLQSQHAACTTEDAIPLRELLQRWETLANQTDLDAQTIEHASQTRTRIHHCLTTADTHGYIDLLNDIIDSLDTSDDTFRSRTTPRNPTQTSIAAQLAHWWTRRAPETL